MVTKHAQKRMKERCGLSKKAIERNALIALCEGVRHNETTGKLKKYIDWLFLSHGHGGNIRLYNNHAYIFTTTDKLITVLPLPNIHKKSVDKILKTKGCNLYTYKRGKNNENKKKDKCRK